MVNNSTNINKTIELRSGQAKDYKKMYYIKDELRAMERIGYMQNDSC
jgi:predicted transcriptional regulator